MNSFVSMDKLSLSFTQQQDPVCHITSKSIFTVHADRTVLVGG